MRWCGTVNARIGPFHGTVNAWTTFTIHSFLWITRDSLLSLHRHRLCSPSSQLAQASRQFPHTSHKRCPAAPVFLLVIVST